MTNWKNIHPDFNEGLQKEWEDLDFNWLEVQEWIEKGSLTPEDAGFAYYLASTSNEPDEIGDMEDKDLEELKESYRSNLFFQQKIKLEEWRDVHSDFTPKLIKRWNK